MKKKLKLPINIAIFVLLIILTFYIILKNEDLFKIANIIYSAKIQYIVIGIICMLLYVVCEAINIGRTLKKLNEKSSFIKNMKYAFIGFFFSAITPAASGGQPMQIYYMHKDNISISNSTLALLINLSSMQIITISFALISLIFNYEYLNKGLIIFFLIGILLNISALALLIIGIFSKKMSKCLVNFFVKLLTFFRIKDIEKKKEKFEEELEKYQKSSIYIRNNKLLILKIILTTLVQFVLYYSVTYWTYRALGLNKYNIFQIITMQSVLYATVSGIPSPGAVGVTEGAFMQIFKFVYPESIISSAVLLNRGINFYFLVIISGIVTMVSHIRSSAKEKI